MGGYVSPWMKEKYTYKRSMTNIRHYKTLDWQQEVEDSIYQRAFMHLVQVVGHTSTWTKESKNDL